MLQFHFKHKIDLRDSKIINYFTITLNRGSIFSDKIRSPIKEIFFFEFRIEYCMKLCDSILPDSGPILGLGLIVVFKCFSSGSS